MKREESDQAHTFVDDNADDDAHAHPKGWDWKSAFIPPNVYRPVHLWLPRDMNPAPHLRVSMRHRSRCTFFSGINCASWRLTRGRPEQRLENG